MPKNCANLCKPLSVTLKKRLCFEEIRDEELKMVLYPADKRRVISEMNGRAVASCSSSRGGADKSLARPTSRCRMKESTVSLERRVCSCAEFQVFSCYRD